MYSKQQGKHARLHSTPPQVPKWEGTTDRLGFSAEGTSVTATALPSRETSVKVRLKQPPTIPPTNPTMLLLIVMPACWTQALNEKVVVSKNTFEPQV